MSTIVIPLKLRGEEVGTMTILDNDKITVRLHEHFQVAVDEIRKLVDMGFVFGLNISPILNPAVDGKLVSRLDNEKPITEVGGFHPSQHPNASKRFLL